MNESATHKYRKRFTSLKMEFDNNWKEHFQDISDYLLTRKGRFLELNTTPNDGEKRNDNVLDGTGGRALRILAAGMQSGLTSPARPWFRLGLADKDLEAYAPVRSYLDETRKRMLSIFSKSNFYSSVHSVYAELGGFGTSAMLIEEDFQHVIRCYPFTIGEYFIATDASLRVNTLYRKFSMTAYNMVRQFGEDNVSDAVRRMAKEHKKDTWRWVIHAIEPNTDRIPDKVDGVNKPIASVYFEEVCDDQDKFLNQSGYDLFPVMAPRWDTTGSEVYGRSPGMEVLPDVMMLQELQRKGLKGYDKMIDPPMNAPTSLKNKAKSIVSGGVTYVDVNQGQQGFTPTHEVRPDLKSAEFKIERVQTAIKEGLFNDLFLMLALSGDKRMTAREVVERHEEKLLAVGPVTERMQPELLDRAIDRTYDIMEKNFLLPPIPPELDGTEIEVEYISILAQAQKMIGTSGIEQVSGFTSSLTEIWPEARHKVNALEAIDQYAKMVGVPVSMINSDDKVKENLETEARQAEVAERADAMERMVEGGKKLSETDLDKNSALKAIMSGGGNPASALN